MTSGPAAAASPRLTIEQWGALAEDAGGELVDGRLEEEETPTPLHEVIAAWLLWTLRSWVAPLGGVAFGAELKLAVASRRGRKADASVYLPGRRLPGRSVGATRRPPSLVVEVLSPRPRDMHRDVVDKRKDYAAFGVTFYWLIDPQAHTVEVLELGGDGRYTVALSAAKGSHAVPGCADLVLDVDALWTSADALTEDDEET